MLPSDRHDAGTVSTAAAATVSSSTQQQQIGSTSLHILDLPAVLLSVCFDFVGPGCYRYVAGTCRMFRDVYKKVDPALEKNWWYRVRNITTTTVNNIAVSVSCAEFCLQEVCQKHTYQPWKARMMCEKIAIQGAESGSLSILLWAKEKGLDFSSDISPAAARGGHFEIIKWTYRIYGFGNSNQVSRSLVERGDLEQLKWALKKECRADWHTWNTAIWRGNLDIINLLFESRAVDQSDCFHWRAWMRAGSPGNIDVLQWMLDHAHDGYEQSGVGDACSAASKEGNLHVLEWAQDQCPLQVTRWFDFKCCARAAYGGSLPVLQWLRERGCPWDGNTLYWAEQKNHLDILAWAKLHKCPETFTKYGKPYRVDRYV